MLTYCLMNVFRVKWPFLNFGTAIISLERAKQGTSNLELGTSNEEYYFMHDSLLHVFKVTLSYLFKFWENNR